MRFLRAVLVGLALWVGASLGALACEVDRPVVIAGLNWDSNAFHAAVAARILKDGFGCQVEVAPGATKPLFKSMMRGDVDIMMEVWTDNLPRLWPEALRAGSVVDAGVNFPDAVQGWFVPRYLVEGPAARAPGLTSVADLPRYKQAFADPEDRNKGRFYNCMLGWGCEKINTAKLHAYGLKPHYTNFRPASGAALVDAIRRHYERREGFLTYYWGPTWVLGDYDLVMLEEPPYDPDVWRRLARTSTPDKATAYPVSPVGIAAGAEFAGKAPMIMGFLEAYETTGAQVSAALAQMNRSGKGAADAAEQFLMTQGAIWQQWIPPEIASRVAEGLPEG